MKTSVSKKSQHKEYRIKYLYLISAEFISGEYSQIFHNTVFALSLEEAEKKTDNYFMNYYGIDNAKQDDNRFIYFDYQVVVKINSVSQSDTDQLIDKLSID